MTICIAAIGKSDELGGDGECIVFATDHMITLRDIGHFEHSIEKYRKINSNTMAMLSGEALLFDDVLKDVKPESNINVISQKIHENMVKIRDNYFENMIFKKLKIGYEDIKEILQLPEYNPTVEKILNTLENYSLLTSILLIGFEGNKAQLIEINELGLINTRDVNFNAIGSGGTQAINTLLFQRHCKNDSLRTTLYNVYKAKRNSEVAEGVGKETDMFILLNKGNIYKIKDKHIGEFNKIYVSEMAFGKEHSQIDEIIKNIGEDDV